MCTLPQTGYYSPLLTLVRLVLFGNLTGRPGVFGSYHGRIGKGIRKERWRMFNCVALLGGKGFIVVVFIIWLTFAFIWILSFTNVWTLTSITYKNAAICRVNILCKSELPEYILHMHTPWCQRRLQLWVIRKWFGWNFRFCGTPKVWVIRDNGPGFGF